MRLSVRSSQTINRASDAHKHTLYRDDEACKVGRMHSEYIRELYEGLNDEELRIAEESLDRYLELAWEIYEELQSRDA